MELQGKKVAIPVESLFNTFEFWYPYYRLKEAGANVVVVGSGSSDTYTGKPGTEVKVDAGIDQVSAADFDGIVIPGGYAPDIGCRHLSCRLDVGFCENFERQDGNFIFCH
jgi:protease I